MFASITQVQTHYSLYSFWTRLEWFKITQFLVLLEKLQTTVAEDQTWGLTWTNEQIWNHCGFYMEKIANLLRVSTSFLSPYFCNRSFCGTRCCETSICRDLYQLKLVCETSISCLEADGSPAPTLWSSLLSPPFPPPLVLGNSLSNSCSTDSCWFSSIITFAMFAISINDFTTSFGVFSLSIISFTREMHWPAAVFTVLTNWMLRKFVSPETPCGEKLSTEADLGLLQH